MLRVNDGKLIFAYEITFEHVLLNVRDEQLVAL